MTFKLNIIGIIPTSICGFVHNGFQWQFLTKNLNKRGDYCYNYSDIINCVDANHEIIMSGIIKVCNLLEIAISVTHNILTLIEDKIGENDNKDDLIISNNDAFRDDQYDDDESDNQKPSRNDNTNLIAKAFSDLAVSSSQNNNKSHKGSKDTGKKKSCILNRNIYNNNNYNKENYRILTKENLELLLLFLIIHIITSFPLSICFVKC